VADIRVFSSASDAPRARRPTDVVLLAAAAAAVGCSLLAAPGPGSLDTPIQVLLAALPGLLGWFWEICYDLLFVWAFALIVLAIASRGRLRLLADQVLAAGIALGAGAIVGSLGGTEWSESVRSLVSSDPPAVFPAVRLAVATAVIAATSPHLSRPLRFLGRWVVVAGALASATLGIALPVGVVAGLALGFGVAALVHLALGSPGGRLSLEQLRVVLDDLDVPVVGLTQAQLEPRGVSLAEATTAEGRSVEVKVYGRDAWDGQLLASLWSSLWNRGEAPRFGGRLQQVEHEAFVTLYAERAGVPVLPVVAAGLAGGRDAVLVVDTLGGRPLTSLDPSEVSDDLLDRVWDAVGRLGGAGIAHGSLAGGKVRVRPDGGVALGDLSVGIVDADEADLGSDRVQVLVASALSAGPERAIAAAVRGIGDDGASRILPFLQPAVLDRATRRAIRDQGWSVDGLRSQLAESIGVEPPALAQLRRVTIGSIATVVVIGLVAYAVISALADVGIQTLIDEFRAADLPWLLVALGGVPTIGVAQAFGTVGACLRPMRFGPVLMLQYAIGFIQLAVPSSAARIALEVRFFQRLGLSSTSAIAIGAIDSVTGFVIQMLLILVITLSGLATLDLGSDASGHSFDGTWLLAAAGVVVVLVAVAFAIPRFRRFLREQTRDRLAEVKESLRVFRRPSKVAMIVGGNLATQLLYAMVLGACVLAFGYRLSLAELILTYTVVSLFAGFMPVPGGMGVAEAGYSAALVALGLPSAVAVSTAIAFRLVTYYLPPVWGGFAMRWLRRHDHV
jgi:uncharacterized membrane protein YbhN (UPF0104 family)